MTPLRLADSPSTANSQGSPSLLFLSQQAAVATVQNGHPPTRADSLRDLGVLQGGRVFGGLSVLGPPELASSLCHPWSRLAIPMSNRGDPP